MFTDAGLEATNNSNEEYADEPVTELINMYRTATRDNQNLSEADITAIKVTNLLFPAVNFITTKSVGEG